MKRPTWHYRQSGVIPFRRSEDGAEIMLITSRSRRRWIIPKGIAEPGISPAASAAKEAIEEAGVTGHVLPDPVARYQYRKWGGICTVAVFLMEVEGVLERWPEQKIRQREWVRPREASERVEIPELREVFSRLQERLADTPLGPAASLGGEAGAEPIQDEKVHATGEVQVIPIGNASSTQAEVSRACDILMGSGLAPELQTHGINVEGDLDTILDSVRRIHRTLHAEGSERVVTVVKVATRTDKKPTLAGKLL